MNSKNLTRYTYRKILLLHQFGVRLNQPWISRLFSLESEIAVDNAVRSLVVDSLSKHTRVGYE